MLAIDCIGATVVAGLRAPADAHVAALPTAIASTASVMSKVFGIGLLSWFGGTPSKLWRPRPDHMGSAAHLLRSGYLFVAK
jgi:hypothetical protein